MTQRGVARFENGVPRSEMDSIAVEEPLEIRVAGETLVITMRTPGRDAHLALGFLFAEGVIEGSRDVGSVAHCGRPIDEGFGNVIDVLPAPGTTLDVGALDGSRRGSLTTAACGTCGRRSIDDLMARLAPVCSDAKPPLGVLERSTEQLRAVQPGFALTGGVHAAAALDVAGGILASAEDVGRHNAVDKVVGELLVSEQLADAAILVVSGRVSFEIVQKAARAAIPYVCAVSAPTSLAIDLAVRARIALLGFVRGGRFNVYADPDHHLTG